MIQDPSINNAKQNNDFWILMENCKFVKIKIGNLLEKVLLQQFVYVAIGVSSKSNNLLGCTDNSGVMP